MAQSSKDLKRRMRSVSNIQQITGAMETVAATKMRTAQNRAIDGRPFAEHAFELLLNIASSVDVDAHPLLKKRETGRQLVLLITTDKGLAGPINSNMFRKLADFVNDQKVNKKRESDFVVIGRKGEDFARKINLKVVATIPSFGDHFGVKDLEGLTALVIEKYESEVYDKIIMAYTNFISTLKQEAFIRGILPLTYEKIQDLGNLNEQLVQKLETRKIKEDEYIFEPNASQVLNKLVPELVAMLIYHNMLEANASEHSARMVAMKNASENAEDINAQLNLSYNRARQEGITKELLEIVGGASQINK